MTSYKLSWSLIDSYWVVDDSAGRAVHCNFQVIFYIFVQIRSLLFKLLLILLTSDFDGVDDLGGFVGGDLAGVVSLVRGAGGADHQAVAVTGLLQPHLTNRRSVLQLSD